MEIIDIPAKPLEVIIQHAIYCALRRNGWSANKAAEELDITSTTVKTYRNEMRNAGWNIPAWSREEKRGSYATYRGKPTKISAKNLG